MVLAIRVLNHFCCLDLSISNRYLFGPLEFSQGLRTMIVPLRLLDRFLNIVRPNTIKKLETCGILAGVLVRAHRYRPELWG